MYHITTYTVDKVALSLYVCVFCIVTFQLIVRLP